MNFCIFFITFIAHLQFGFGTIDLTLPELQHVSNHLTKDECRKLIASLHFDSFKLNKNVEDAENTVPEDVGCLKLLLHWNSSPGEGRGETHEKLSLRLRQIGRRDLAEWLDSAILQELEGEINKTVQDFRSNPNKQESQENTDVYQGDFEEEFIDDEYSWDFMQAVLTILFVVTASITIFLVISKVAHRYRLSQTDTQEEIRRMGSKIYKKLPQ